MPDGNQPTKQAIDQLMSTKIPLNVWMTLR